MNNKIPVYSEFAVTLTSDEQLKYHRDIRFSTWDKVLSLEVWQREDCGAVRHLSQPMTLEEALAVRRALSQAIESFKAQKER